MEEKMLIICIVALIAGVITYKVCAQSYREDGLSNPRETDTPLVVMFFVCVGTAAATVLCYGLSNSVSKAENQHEVRQKTIITLAESNEVSGSFYLASGSIGGEMYYEYYYLTPDGGKMYEKIRADQVVVFEDDRMDAYLAVIKNSVGCPGDKSGWLYCIASDKDNTIGNAIHVPRGTIKNAGKFGVDLKR
ncbi:MAG: hypothetical protein WC457_00640 [Patescibacteria group bacterium]